MANNTLAYILNDSRLLRLFHYYKELISVEYVSYNTIETEKINKQTHKRLINFKTPGNIKLYMVDTHKDLEMLVSI